MSAVDDRIHSLEIPLIGCSLLVPSAAVAEVTNPTTLHPVPGGPAWLLGVVGWRAQAVSLVSFEGMIGKAVSNPQPTSKIVVFYPVSGRRAGDFYAILSASEPRPQSVSANTLEIEDPSLLPDSPLIATGVRIKSRSMMIPDFDALHSAFYP
ncbi:MAG TPA: chemotaxis protein CheW [Burkholderiales bacterium]|jgi:chemosensory pili system protein ChpC